MGWFIAQQLIRSWNNWYFMFGFLNIKFLGKNAFIRLLPNEMPFSQLLLMDHKVKQYKSVCLAQTRLMQMVTYLEVNILATYLFTRLEESSLVPAGFLTAQFLQKTWSMKPLFWWGEFGGSALYCLHGEKGKYWKARRMTTGLVFTFFLHCWSKEEKVHLSSPIKMKAS